MTYIVDIPVPFDQYTETVRPEWIDHNGHMNMAYYVLAFDEASGALMRYIGIDQPYRDRTGHGTVFLRELEREASQPERRPYLVATPPTPSPPPPRQQHAEGREREGGRLVRPCLRNRLQD